MELTEAEERDPEIVDAPISVEGVRAAGVVGHALPHHREDEGITEEKQRRPPPEPV